MSLKTDARLTPRERLTCGLRYSAAGPVAGGRGEAGSPGRRRSADPSTAGIGDRYRRGRMARTWPPLNLPSPRNSPRPRRWLRSRRQALHGRPPPGGRRRRSPSPAALVAAVLAGSGGVSHCPPVIATGAVAAAPERRRTAEAVTRPEVCGA